MRASVSASLAAAGRITGLSAVEGTSALVAATSAPGMSLVRGQACRYCARDPMRPSSARPSLMVASVLALAIPVAGCGDQQGGTGPTFDYPRDGELRLNHLQAKGTHNSYHIAPEGDLIPALEYTHMPLDVQLSSQGVRQFELDVR